MELLGETDGEGLARLGLADAEGLILGDAEALGDCDPEGLVLAELDALGEALRDAELLGDIEALGLIEGEELLL